MILIIFIIKILFISLTYQICDIDVNIVRSETIPKNIFVQIERSDKKISKLIKLKDPNSEKKFKIKHFNCMEEKIKVSSIKKFKKEYMLVDRKEAFLDGKGSITYKVN